MEIIVACCTQSYQVVWRITTHLTAFKVMYMQFDSFLCSGMSATALACIVITLQNILANIVLVVHLTELVVGSYRQRLSGEHCL